MAPRPKFEKSSSIRLNTRERLNNPTWLGHGHGHGHGRSPSTATSRFLTRDSTHGITFYKVRS